MSFDGKKILVFAGTTEGRKFIFSALNRGYCVTASVATEYGEAELKSAIRSENPALQIISGRLDRAEIESLLRSPSSHFFACIDATHPYAARASENIAAACFSVSVPYFRLSRAVRLTTPLPRDSLEFPSMNELCNFLADSEIPCYAEGNIFVSTGSKEIELFSKIPDFENRVVARVLPSSESIEKCKRAGISQNRIIAMQGPFSKNLNEAIFREFSIKILVTKESGEAGGFYEKIEAAEVVGIKVLLIKPPEEKSQIFCEDEVFSLLEKQ